MSQAKGSQAQLLGAVKETTYGSDPASISAVNLPINSSAIKKTRNLITPATIRGRRDAVQPAQGNTNVAGDVVVPVDLINIGYWLQMLLGDPTTTGTDPYTHTFKVGDSIDSWVLEQGYTDIAAYQKFNGCKANTFSMKVGGDEELVATIGILGASGTTGTSSMDSSPTTESFTRLNNFQASIKEGGSTIATCKEAEFEINNNLDPDVFVIGEGGVRGSLPEGTVNVTGRLMVMFENWTLYNKAVNATETSLEIALTSGSYGLTFTINELLFEENAPGIETPGGIWLELPFQAYYDDHADDSIVVVELVNSKSAY